MFKTNNDLSESIRVKVIELLNARLADAIDLQTQTKQSHWNVKGPTFIALHELFDKINEEVEDYVDDLAERAVQLGGVAEGTARMAAKRSSLGEYHDPKRMGFQSLRDRPTAPVQQRDRPEDGGFRRRAFVRFVSTVSRSSGWTVAHRHSSVTGSRNTRPSGVRSYSTLGGTSAYTVRMSSPAASNARSVCVNIFFDTSGRWRCISPYRFVPWRRMYRTMGVHLSPINSSRRRDG